MNPPYFAKEHMVAAAWALDLLTWDVLWDAYRRTCWRLRDEPGAREDFEAAVCERWETDAAGAYGASLYHVPDESAGEFRSERLPEPHRDMVAEFLEAKCVLAGRVNPTEFYQAFAKWCISEGEYVVPLNRVRQHWESLGVQATKEGGKRWLRGVRLKRDFDNWANLPE